MTMATKKTTEETAEGTTAVTDGTTSVAAEEHTHA